MLTGSVRAVAGTTKLTSAQLSKAINIKNIIDKQKIPNFNEEFAVKRLINEGRVFESLAETAPTCFIPLDSNKVPVQSDTTKIIRAIHIFIMSELPSRGTR
jgi:hypothetical protein